MAESGLDCRRQVSPTGHVGNPVVQQDGIESLAEGEIPHITLHEVTFGIERGGEVQHGGTQVQTRDLETPLEVEHVFPAAAADVEQGRHGTLGVLPNQPHGVIAIPCVLGRVRSPHRPQPCEVAVKSAGGGGVIHGGDCVGLATQEFSVLPGGHPPM